MKVVSNKARQVFPKSEGARSGGSRERWGLWQASKGGCDSALANARYKCGPKPQSFQRRPAFFFSFSVKLVGNCLTSFENMVQANSAWAKPNKPVGQMQACRV